MRARLKSWARPDLIAPYLIYVKMAYHLAEEARAGLSEFSIPSDFRDTLFDFQAAAVKIAARHLEKRGGVIIGDVVGLGKTLMATALSRVFQDPPHSLETLIICPKNLVGMWEDHAARFRLLAKIEPLSQARNQLNAFEHQRFKMITEHEQELFRRIHLRRLLEAFVLNGDLGDLVKEKFVSLIEIRPGSANPKR